MVLPLYLFVIFTILGPITVIRFGRAPCPSQSSPCWMVGGVSDIANVEVGVPVGGRCLSSGWVGHCYLDTGF